MSRGMKVSRQREKDYLYGKRSFGKKGQYITVVGTISRFGKKQQFEKGGVEVWLTTACIQDVHDKNGNKLTDHVWIDIPKGQRYEKGQVLQLEGQVSTYSKIDYNFGGYRTNYKLSNVRNISVIE